MFYMLSILFFELRNSNPYPSLFWIHVSLYFPQKRQPGWFFFDFPSLLVAPLEKDKNKSQVQSQKSDRSILFRIFSWWVLLLLNLGLGNRCNRSNLPRVRGLWTRYATEKSFCAGSPEGRGVTPVTGDGTRHCIWKWWYTMVYPYTPTKSPCYQVK